MLELNSLSFTVRLITFVSLIISGGCAIYCSHKQFQKGKNIDPHKRTVPAFLRTWYFSFGMILLLAAAVTTCAAFYAPTMPRQSTNSDQPAPSTSPQDSTTAKLEPDSATVMGKYTVAQKQSILIDYIKTKIQTNNDDAQVLLFYGTISLGIIALLLPIYLVKKAPSWYWISLSMGTMLFALGAFGTIWYSRQQVAWSNRASAGFLDVVVKSSEGNATVSSVINEFYRCNPPPYKNWGAVFHASKSAILAGMVFYASLFLYGMIYSYVKDEPFFQKKE